MQHGLAGEPLPPGSEPWQRLEGVANWDALVLPRPVMEELRQVPAQFSERFWADPGAASASGKRGLLLLFSGPSGTGKTLAARILGGELHLPVLQADVADLAGRGRGEAAHAVGRLFTAAQRTGAVVVLERADLALTAGIAGEAEVSGVGAVDAHDLLRRAEAYPGIVVVPTERPVLDTARARFDQVIAFPFPDATARGEIWRRALPPGLRLPGEVIALLGAALEVPGGAIAAMCAEAVAQAQAAGEVLRPEHVADVVEQRYDQVGPNVSVALARLRGWARSETWASGPRGDAPPLAARPETPLTPLTPLASPPARSPSPSAPAPEAAPKSPLRPPAAPPAPARWAPAAAAPPPVAVPTPSVRDEPKPWAAEPRRAEPEKVRPAAVTPETVKPEGAKAETVKPRVVEPRAVEPQRPPEPARRGVVPVPGQEARRHARRGLLALAVVGALSAVGLGIAVAQRGKTPAPAAPPGPVALNQTASVGPLHFTYPSGWSAQSATPISGLTLQPATMLTSATRPTGDMVIGITNTPSTTPLPTTFIASTIQGQPAPEAVTLGTHHFIRVLDPRVSSGAQSRSIYVLPSGAGTVIGLCDTASKSFVSTCERILATLQVTVPKPRPAGPHPNLAYAHSLSAIVSRLNTARSADSRLLAGAQTPATQAAAARLLASAHAQASTAVGALSAGSAAAANAALAASLHQASLAYATLARAAAAGSATVYAKAVRGVDAANAAIAADLARLRTFGYAVR